jgi:hypothetical protein
MELTFHAYSNGVLSTVLDKWVGKVISYTRRSKRRAATYGGNILADYDVILWEVDQLNSSAMWKPAFESYHNVSREFLHARGCLS